MHLCINYTNFAVMNRRKLYLSAAIAIASTAAVQGDVQSTIEGIRNVNASGYALRGALMRSDTNMPGSIDQLRRALSLPLLSCDERRQAELNLALALMREGSPEGETLMLEYLNKYPAESDCLMARLQLADYYFYDGDYARAALRYSDSDYTSLQGDVKQGYTYRNALSQMYTGQLQTARTELQKLVAGGGEYVIAARYYIAYIDYLKGNYPAAYQGFGSIISLLPEYRADMKGETQYVPTTLSAIYYMAQIEFLRGQYTAVAEYASYLNTSTAASEGYRRELTRIVGESMYKLSRYNEARRMLEKYLAMNPDPASPSALYSLGAIYYARGEYARARQCFEQITSEQNVVGQCACLYMGQLEARDNNTANAALYFEKAYRLNCDNDISETALYNYIASTTDGGVTPFTSPTSLMEEYLRYYPTSSRASQVRQALTVAYYNDRDYTRALESISRISNPDPRALAMKQKVLYELGVTEVTNGVYSEAVGHLRQAAAMTDRNRQVALQAQLWLGQALYEQGKFKEAEAAYRTYLSGNTSSENTPQALYDMGYALYMQDRYADALTYFKKALATGKLSPTLVTDVKVRMGDCYYYAKDYKQAALLFAQAEQEGNGDNAYAAMRAAIMLGLQGDNIGEIDALKQMTSSYPDSKWVPSALYELASTYARIGEVRAATETFTHLADTYPNLEEGRRGQLQLANLLAQSSETTAAINAYKKLIQRWPTSDEAATANVDLRRLMSASQEQISEYVAFMNSVPGAPKINADELEKITYDAAENRWIKDNTDIAGLRKYIEQYPDGQYLADALGNISWSLAEVGKYAEALEYIKLLEQKRPDSSQLPEALRLKASILEEKYPQRSAEALAAYRKAEQLSGAALDSKIYSGIMRLTDSPAERLAYADKVLATQGLEAAELEEASLYKALALIALNRDTEAEKLLINLSKNPAGINGARAAVELGNYYLSKKKYQNAQRLLTTFTENGTPHQYWLARGYIALADTYSAQGKKSTAREYLIALRNNYPGHEADILKMIDDRLK